jgi:hypothetical protein
MGDRYYWEHHIMINFKKEKIKPLLADHLQEQYDKFHGK